MFHSYDLITLLLLMDLELLNTTPTELWIAIGIWKQHKSVNRTITYKTEQHIHFISFVFQTLLIRKKYSLKMYQHNSIVSRPQKIATETENMSLGAVAQYRLSCNF